MSELTGRELDRAIAEALGLNPQWSGEPYNNWWYSITGDDDLVMLSTSIPRYHADLNAVAAVCAERGWRLTVMPDVNAVQVEKPDAESDDGWRFYEVETPVMQEAAARALYAVLTAG